MKVWQPGGHLSEDRAGSVGDWSWGRTRRRIALLIGLALPYRARTAGALVTLLAYTLVALAPPYLAKLATTKSTTSSLSRARSPCEMPSSIASFARYGGASATSV